MWFDVTIGDADVQRNYSGVDALDVAHAANIAFCAWGDEYPDYTGTLTTLEVKALAP